MKSFQKVIFSFFFIFGVSLFVPFLSSQSSQQISRGIDNDDRANVRIKKMVNASKGCNEDVVVPSLVGHYVDNYGYDHSITPEKWIMSSNSSSPLIFKFCTVNNSSKVIVAENNPNNSYFPNRFSQFNWTISGDSLWYCQIVYDANSIQNADLHPRADSTNPSTGGCGECPWSQLIVKSD